MAQSAGAVGYTPRRVLEAEYPFIQGTHHSQEHCGPEW